VAVVDGAIDARVFLVNHAPGADVEVPDFRIAHLPGRQADRCFRSLDQGVWVVMPEPIEIRFGGARDGIVGVGDATAETIEDEQENGLFGDRHERILSYLAA
jgi:hypothetical protein